MRRLTVLILLLAALLALAACGAEAQEAEVWRVVRGAYLDGGGSAIEAETVDVPAGLGEIAALIAGFNAEAGSPSLRRALPEGALIENWTLASGELRLYVQEGFTELARYERALAEACAALTFCAVEGVESVSLYSGDTQLTTGLTPEKILLRDGDET